MGNEGTHKFSPAHECCEICGIDRVEYEMIRLECYDDTTNVSSIELQRRKQLLKDLINNFSTNKNTY